MDETAQEIEAAGKILCDPNCSLATRFRALFTLRNIPGKRSVDLICKVLLEDKSALLKHECAFVLGQMSDASADEVLKEVLANKSEHCMVRHEAGEALAAIGSPSSFNILQEYSTDPVLEVAQTCMLASQNIILKKTNNAFNSIDPTPPLNDEADISKLEDILSDASLDLFLRYQALFALRNLRSKEAVNALGRALLKYQDDENNNLLKHELGYVFGQLQDEDSIQFLKQILENKNECEMVRHEVAEALGSIASPEAEEILIKFKDDEVQVVRESIQVALDMALYERSDQKDFLDTMNGH